MGTEAYLISEAFVVIGAVLFVRLFIVTNRLRKNGEWHPTSHVRCKRWVNGQWQYRDMTHEEQKDLGYRESTGPGSHRRK